MAQPPPIIPSTSPCVRNCCLDENDVCLGCGRELDEILRWQQATESERDLIRTAAAKRVQQRRVRRGD